MIHSVRYVVKDEHTLGYLVGDSDNMGILAGSVIRGGHNWLNGSVSVFGSAIRDATHADFAAYRVCVPPDFQPGQVEVSNV